jgi:hypothetical protein
MNQSEIEEEAFRGLSSEQISAFKYYLNDFGISIDEDSVCYGSIFLAHKCAFSCGWDSAKEFYLEK